jgi:hypothetical protein
MLWIVIYNVLQSIGQLQSLTRGWTAQQINQALQAANLDPGMKPFYPPDCSNANKHTGITNSARTLMNTTIDARILQQIRGVFDGYIPPTIPAQPFQGLIAAGRCHCRPANQNAVLPPTQIPQLTPAVNFRLGAPLNVSNTPIPLPGPGGMNISSLVHNPQAAASAPARNPGAPGPKARRPKSISPIRKARNSKELADHYLDGIKDWSREGITHPDRTYSHSPQKKPLPFISTIQEIINLVNPKLTQKSVDTMTLKQCEAFLRGLNGNRHVKGAALPSAVMKGYIKELVHLFSQYYDQAQQLDSKNPAYNADIVRELFVKRDAITDKVKEQMSSQKKATTATRDVAQELKRKHAGEAEGANKKLRTENAKVGAQHIEETAAGAKEIEGDEESLDTQLLKLAGDSPVDEVIDPGSEDVGRKTHSTQQNETISMTSEDRKAVMANVNDTQSEGYDSNATVEEERSA